MVKLKGRNHLMKLSTEGGYIQMDLEEIQCGLDLTEVRRFPTKLRFEKSGANSC